MNDKIRIGIVGYGNLGKGARLAIVQNPDMELIAIFTRRNVDSIHVEDKQVKVLNIHMAEEYVDLIDVMLLCGGSAVDLPVQGPYFASMYNTVDSYDNHGNISEYFRDMDKASKLKGKTSTICIGWDPGLFSMNRILFESILPKGESYTFWGPGLSQGHSDAIRRVVGVKDGVQYTIPIKDALEAIRRGKTPQLTTGEKHIRKCYVVEEEGADKDKILKEIKSMPNYFLDYDTEVIFISEKELKENHSQMLHGGFVIRCGSTGREYDNNHLMEFSLKLDNNPEFTSSILLAYARATYKLNKEGHVGAKTVFDIPLKYLSNRTSVDLCKSLL